MKFEVTGRLRILSIGLGVLFASLTTSCFIESAYAGEGPRAVIAESEYNFGTVSEGTKVTHDFDVKNGGSGDLTIQRVVASCGCTASSATKELLKPGESAKIHVEFDTTGFSGEKLKTVRVYTNDQDNPTSMVSIKGVVEPDIIVEPKRIICEDISAETLSSGVSREVSIKVSEGNSATISAIKSPSEYISVEELVSNPRQRTLKLTLDPKAPLGELRDRIVVNIAGDKQKSINIPVLAMIRGNVEFVPSGISFGLVDGKDPMDRAVKLTNHGREPLKIKEIKSDNPAITASMKTIQEGKNFVLNVKLDPTKVNRELRGTIEVTTDNKEQAVLRLGVFAALKPKV